MSPKELLYIEDALGHECHMRVSSQSLSQQLQDPQLQDFARDLTQRHRLNFDRMMDLLK